MAKRVSKQTKTRLMWFAIPSLFLICYFLFTVGVYGYKIVNLALEEKELKTKLVSLQAQEQNLKIEMQKLKDPDYLARYARENYLYSKDGEYIIKIEEKDKADNSSDKYDKYIEYIIYGAGIITLFIFIYIVVKCIKK